MQSPIDLANPIDIMLDFEKGYGHFPIQPTPRQISEINDFIRDGGRPESHPDLCLQEPNREDNLLIVGQIDMPDDFRKKGGKVWCCFCRTFKFHDGRYLWSSDQKSLYPIGNECAHSKVGRDVWKNMIHEFHRRRTINNADNLLLDAPQRISRSISTLENLVPLARQLDHAHHLLFEDIPNMAAQLNNFVRRHDGRVSVTRQVNQESMGPTGFNDREGGSHTTEDVIGIIDGQRFLSKSLRISTELRKSITELQLLKIDSDNFTVDQILEQFIKLSDDNRLELSEKIVTSLNRCDRLIDKIFEAAKFLTLRNFQLIEAWVHDPDSNAACSTAKVEGSKLVLRTNEFFNIRLNAIDSSKYKYKTDRRIREETANDFGLSEMLELIDENRHA